jgi:hypothetical protein
MPYTITREDPERDLRALRGALSGFPIGISSSIIPALQELADSIEEQLSKPAIEEPIKFGSIVRAGIDGLSDRVLWQRLCTGGWQSEHGTFTASFDWLDHPEVLRVGIGDCPACSESAPEWARLDAANADEDAYAKGITKGIERAKAVHILRLRDLRSVAISAERKDAYDKAIRAVEEPLP